MSSQAEDMFSSDCPTLLNSAATAMAGFWLASDVPMGAGIRSCWISVTRTTPHQVFPSSALLSPFEVSHLLPVGPCWDRCFSGLGLL